MFLKQSEKLKVDEILEITYSQVDLEHHFSSLLGFVVFRELHDQRTINCLTQNYLRHWVFAVLAFLNKLKVKCLCHHSAYNSQGNISKSLAETDPLTTVERDPSRHRSLLSSWCQWEGTSTIESIRNEFKRSLPHSLASMHTPDHYDNWSVSFHFKVLITESHILSEVIGWACRSWWVPSEGFLNDAAKIRKILTIFNCQLVLQNLRHTCIWSFHELVELISDALQALRV